ncbi:hypothetical protein EBBID32_6420 [Sphingobium indicum BiD32]|uniref:Uncharacterized protein n=1 Tax=Sphingobium indicum BiD32 TaxID=1301087 RepID=N1MHQ4_9SPHN|nr:hypothetical protein EBBID32_6420 [Sphingobium indicum BiD32]
MPFVKGLRDATTLGPQSRFGPHLPFCRNSCYMNFAYVAF